MATTTIDALELKHYIEEHISEIHTIEDVSQQLGRSPESIRKAFKRSGEMISLGT